ncbi:MAG TPA: hypothetical protein VH000_01395, partial [Rhizomicrobium sp.]|nr:hypothetical protein [Rhizomicrobium sp.]
DTCEPEFSDPRVQFFTVPGTKRDEAALTVSIAGGTTLILNDILANVRNAEGLNGVVARLFGFAGQAPQIPLPEKIAIIDDKPALARQFRQWADEPALKRIIVSHGDIIDDNPAQVLRDVARTLG